MIRERFSRRDKRNRGFVVRRGGHRASLRRKRFALHAIHQRTAIQRRDGYSQGGLRQAVDGKLRFAAETVGCETVRKTLECLWIYRLGAIQSRAPRTEVDALDILVRDFAHAEFIGKIWRGSDGAAVFVKRLQPALRARQESQWRHHRQRRAEMQQR